MPFTLHTDRTLNYSWRISNRSYAVGSKPRRLPGQLARFASGRVEWDMLFPEHVARSATCSGKDKKYHAAAGDSAVHRVKRPV